MKIGFFDSGLGGLTILKATVRELPQYNYTFYGDTANLPYGDKSESEIFEHTKEGMEYLFEAGAALNIIACNTASAETARRLQTEFLLAKYPGRKILAVIIPTVEELQHHDVTSALLLATKRTVDSNKYKIELEKNPDNKVVLTQVATPELVPLIELNEIEGATKEAIKKIDEYQKKGRVVILGCTHYTQIKNQLRDHYGDEKIIVSQDEVIPKKIKSYLKAHPEITSKLTHGGQRNIHLTAHRPDYDILMGHFLGGVYTEEI